MVSSTLACSLTGSFGPGQCGDVEKTSSCEAQVSNTTGDGCVTETGAANSVNRRQMKASEFSVFPSTAPACAGTATTTVWAEAADPSRTSASPATIAGEDLAMAAPLGDRRRPVAISTEGIEPSYQLKIVYVNVNLQLRRGGSAGLAIP